MKKVWITAYDIFSARIAESLSMDAILLGDSLGMTVYGFESTREVTKELMRHHYSAVKKYAPNTRIVVDIPYGCDANPLILIETLEFFSEKGAQEYKLELCEENFSCLLEARSRGYRIVAHLGFLPQSETHARVVGKTKEEENMLLALATRADAMGVSAIVLECIPEALAQKITETVSTEVIGIGAGRFVDGQILVFDDVIGKTDDSFTPKFLRRFGNAAEEAKNAVIRYQKAVQEESFPSSEEKY